MKRFFTLLLLLFSFASLLAQGVRERVISGTLRDTDGSPLPGVSITIKGTTTGTSTDINGYYSITAPIGSTLVISYVGFSTKEVLVTEEGTEMKAKKGIGNPQNQQTKPIKQKDEEKVEKSPAKPIVFALPKQGSLPQGVAVLTEETPSYRVKGGELNVDNVRSIQFQKVIGKTGNASDSGQYVIKVLSGRLSRRLTGQFTSSFGFERINRLPAFQTTYAQGRPFEGNFTWMGADKGEIFSWGPPAYTLAYDGQTYPYDLNGQLVSAGQGNGKLANYYDPTRFFKTGIQHSQELLLSIKGPKMSQWSFNVERRSRTGVIPNATYHRWNYGIALKGWNIFRRLTADARFSYHTSEGDLIARGANLPTLVGSVFRTPTTFDNTNGSSDPLHNASSYQLPDGTYRTHAPGQVDNPYAFAALVPDREQLKRLFSSVGLRWNVARDVDINLQSSMDRQVNKEVFGLPAGFAGAPTGRLTEREDEQFFFYAMLSPKYEHNFDNHYLQVVLNGQINDTRRELGRTDGFGFEHGELGQIAMADSLLMTNLSRNRTTFEGFFKAQYNYRDWLIFRWSQRHYFSNTVQYSSFHNFLPTVSLSLNLGEILPVHPINHFNIYGIYSKSIREAPLLYANWAYRSTQLPVSQYANHAELGELPFQNSLLPELEEKWEGGAKMSVFNGRMDMEWNQYVEQTDQFIAPVSHAEGFALTNIAKLSQHGTNLTVAYNHHSYRSIDWGIEAKWARYQNTVKKLYSLETIVPLAGFQSTASVLAEGKPVGAIYGSTYLRENGKIVIGDDGFPLINPESQMVGNPIPDWVLNWSGFMTWKEFKLSCLFEWKKGGDIWNGTQGVLNYLGRSAETGGGRLISGYVFEGVDQNGQPNTKPVNFSDPNLPVEANRWTRYGWSGVTEDLIEDASWFRLNEVTLSYTTARYWVRDVLHLRDISFALIGKNLFVITPYSGVDPAATLFGNSAGTGLDLFNVPSTRSFTAQLTIRL